MLLTYTLQTDKQTNKAFIIVKFISYNPIYKIIDTIISIECTLLFSLLTFRTLNSTLITFILNLKNSEGINHLE